MWSDGPRRDGDGRGIDPDEIRVITHIEPAVGQREALRFLRTGDPFQFEHPAATRLRLVGLPAGKHAKR